MNRFEYFITQGSKTSIESMKVTFAADTTLKVVSALSTDFNFLEPPPAAESDDRKNWTISGATPLNSITVEASSEGNTGGTSTFDISLAARGQKVRFLTLTLVPTGWKQR